MSHYKDAVIDHGLDCDDCRDKEWDEQERCYNDHVAMESDALKDELQDKIMEADLLIEASPMPPNHRSPLDILRDEILNKECFNPDYHTAYFIWRGIVDRIIELSHPESDTARLLKSKSLIVSEEEVRE